MTLQVPQKITLNGFMEWMKKNTQCELRIRGNRINAVVLADNIESGKCVPLFAERNGDKIMITELSNDYHSPEVAWQALEASQADSYPAVPFHDWVQDQYLTARSAKVESFIF